MIKTSKRFLFILLISLMSIIFCGCHKAKKLEMYKIPEEFDISKTYNLTFWAKNDNNVAQKRIYQNAITSFEEIYPNIKITLKSYSEYGTIYNDVITNISTSTIPNVCISYPDHVATYATGENIVVPLDDVINDENYGLGGSKVRFTSIKKEEVVKKYLDEGYFSNHYYTLPFMRSTEACYINKTYVESLGYTLPETLTWDFIWEVCKKAMDEKTEDQILIPFIYKSTDNMMIQMLAQKDAGYSDENGSILLFNDETRKILKEISTYVKEGMFSTFNISSYPGNFLNAGQCIFAIDSTAGSTWIGSKAPLLDIKEENLVDFETEVMVIPQYDVNDIKMISQGPSLCLFNKEDPQEVLASWLFAQYLLTNEIQIAYSETEGYVPVTKKAQESREYQDYLSRSGEDNNKYYDVKIKATKMLLDNTENTFVTEVFNGSTSLRTAAGTLINETAKSVLKKEEINDEYINSLFKKTISSYRLDRVSMIELGKMPSSSIILLGTLGFVWSLIIIYYIRKIILKKKEDKKVK